MLGNSIKDRRKRHFIKRILLSPAKLINTSLSVLSYKLRLSKVPALPIVLDIEPTNACNFRCPHCQVTYADWVKKNMSMEQFSKVIDMFPHALRVKLQGMGEPFLNKDLMKFIEKVCSRQYWCELTSNGSLLDRHPVETLNRYDNFQLTISVDAPEKELFEKIRPGSNFEKIVENIKKLAAVKNFNISAWMVVEKDNKNYIKETIRLLKSLGVRVFGLQIVVIDYGKEELKSETIDKRIETENKRRDYDEWTSTAKEEDVQLDISDTLYDEKSPCPWPWYGIYVDVVGNVVPCCRIGDASVCNMGNINTTPFKEIWQSEKYMEFRNMHKNNDIPKICASCYKQE